MIVEGKFIIKIGALATALAAIFGGTVSAVSVAKPWLNSGPPPLAGRSEVTAVDGKIAQLAQNFQAMQQNQAFLAQGFWTNQLIAAQQQLRANPNNMAARQQAAIAQQQLAQIQRQLYGR